MINFCPAGHFGHGPRALKNVLQYRHVYQFRRGPFLCSPGVTAPILVPPKPGNLLLTWVGSQALGPVVSTG